ncbi:MAG: translation elongation factor Ts [Candidatus Omnitrophica bacterium]|nr:translation elongation factor Ts [Candidatus Omnitrophota bacterium]
MTISVEIIKELRNLTAASIADCKKALEDAGGNLEKAQEILRKRGLEKAASKQNRSAKEGRVEAYIHHGNKIGVLVELNCETDFVAKNEAFAQFAKDIAMQIAALAPQYVSREDVPEEILAKQLDKEQFVKSFCLLEQTFIKDPSLTIKDYLGSLIAKFNEKIVIKQFSRYQIG